MDTEVTGVVTKAVDITVVAAWVCVMTIVLAGPALIVE